LSYVNPRICGAFLALAIALACAVPASAQTAGGITPITPATPTITEPSGTAFDGDGMWIWYVSKSSGGNVDQIAADAQAHGIETVFIKSSDGNAYWGQFSKALVDALHARGLKVCAWPFIYGNAPTTEAKLSARAVARGADCLVIDAEGQYEGKYVSASTYMTKLRKLVGPDYPIGLAGFPYVDYHPGFPYSVFLGPGGAQYNVPQMYWRDIGVTVDEIYAHAYAWNTLYGRKIYPLGQLYQNPPAKEVVRFRQLAQAYGATGVSWWSWQSASARGLGALTTPLQTLAGAEPLGPIWPTLGKKAKGDFVIWAQQHLGDVELTGKMDAPTRAAIKTFQTDSGLTVTGALDPPTWFFLLQQPMVAKRWKANPGSSHLKPLRREIAPKTLAR
jgi:peptidoglycan hydrolase-like protein with peptidoglycan-binding domain